MNCRDVEPLLMPYVDGELVDGERVQVEQHLTVCPPCARHADVARHNRTLVRTLAKQGSPAAPQALRDRVLNTVRATEQHRRQRQVLRLSAAAAGVALCAVVGHGQWRSFQRRLYAEDAVRRHARQFPLEVRIPQPEALEAWFDGKLGHRVAVPRFPNAVAEGARVLNVREKQAAYIRYDAPAGASVRPRQVGLFVFGDTGNDVDVGARGDADLRNSNGYNVVSWRDGDLVYQLVTDLDEDDIRSLLPPEPRPRRGELPSQVQPRPPLEVQPAAFRP
ncbi:MAG: zf-HC2 domain-containing protein [Myxococcaceae bacterium]|nr:zf-HC2 domain-containing protein [Myxococcaceae bacterium]MCA3014867.1 zf-HC2 domain-containing protein [Myxococcaceae bacterium]